MITKLKKRPRTDSFGAEPVKARRKWDRALYLTLLGGFALAMLNYVAGDLVFLRADGLVLRDRSVIAATSLVRIGDVEVTEGQTVREGDVLLQAEALEILDRLAELSMRDAELAEREASLRTQKQLAESLLPLVEERTVEIDQTRGSLDAPQVSGLITATRRESVLESAFAANVELVTLTAQADGLAAELAAIKDARAHARGALDELEEHYASGVYRAGTDGVVGDTVPAPGEVFNPGEPILTVLSGTPYVLAYLPTTYLFDVSQGDRVVVSGGNTRAEGTVDSILPVSQSIPDEFRNAFRLDETRQLARIVLDGESEFPTFSAVGITRDVPWSDWRRFVEDAAARLPRLLDAGPVALAQPE